MSRTANTGLLALVCLLLVVVLGAVQSGPIDGVSYRLPGYLAFVEHPASANRTGHQSQQTVVVSTTSQQVTTVTSSTKSAATSSDRGPVSNVYPISLNGASWFILIAVVLSLGAGMAFLLTRSENPKVFDLRGAIEEMKNQRSHFEGSWSQKLRNAALLRYYVLMAEVCAKVGILDGPTETPNEFIERASAELEVAGPDSNRFAEVVDRAHYGAELSSDEVQDASRFMDSFTTSVVRRVGLG